MSYSLCYDGYNQSAHTEVSMTLRSANGGSESNDACPKVAYGYANDAQTGFPIMTETAQTQKNGTAPGHETGVMRTIGFKYKQSEKSQKPFAENGESQALSSSCHDLAVALGFKAGQSANGGLGDEREVSPTLSHKHSALEPTVAQDNGDAVSFTRAAFRRNNRFDISDATPTITAKSAAGDTDVNIIQMRYIVRRLTPIECERLMGLPDSYTIPVGLRRFFDADGEPSPELVSEFKRTFDTFNAIMAKYEHKKPPKPKSAKQVADWLKKISCAETCPDSPRYKGCGNGWATNQPRWILTRLLAADGIDPFESQPKEREENK